MTVTSGFYDSLAGDRKYNAEQMSRIFEGIITNGIFQSVGGALIVSASTGMTVNVATGRAWFKNTWTYNDATLPLTLDPSEVALNRIDRIILEINKDLAVRANTIKILKGTAAGSPVAPTLANTATLIQYSLSDIYVGAGVTAITAGNMTNKVGTVDTPFITGILTAIDAASMLTQFEANFNVWFQNLQDELDANQATNLQNQVNELYAQTNLGWIAVADVWTYSTPNAIVVPTNATLKYKKGWAIRFKQGGSFKHMYITSVAATLLSVTAGIENVVDNAPITDISFAPNPAAAYGFQGTFNCAPPTWDTTTIDNGTAGQQPTPASQYFSIRGNELVLAVVLGGAGAVKNNTGTSISWSALPATLPPSTEPVLMPLGPAYTVANSIGLVGVAVDGAGAPMVARFSTNIIDNQTVIYTGVRIKYKF